MAFNKKILIGTVGESYAHRRNFTDLNKDKVIFKRAYDLLTIYRFLLRKPFFHRLFASTKLKSMHYEINLFNYDMYHFFNTVSNSSKPWFSTFEHTLPRWNYAREKEEVIMLESDSCKKLIALSQIAYDMQSRKLKNKFPRSHDNLMSKTIVLHPPQQQHISSWNEKGLSTFGTIKFCFVGNLFFRKGGMQMLEVFEELINDGYDISLVIISKMEYGDFVSKTTLEDLKRAMDIINRNNLITLYENLANSEVLKIMKTIHVGLLPSFADTYGYSVLEFQSFACPVITTNISALPEINDNKKGWIIDVERDEKNWAIYDTPSNLNKLEKTVKIEIKNIIKEIVQNPDEIIVKGNLSLQQLEIKHSPQKHGDILYKLYKENLD